jgi:fructuronate reductase
VQRPRYDRNDTSAGVVHLGIGAFHRAHQAVVFDDLLAGGDRRWAVSASSLRSAAVRDDMAPQDLLYSVKVATGSEEQVRIIGAIKQLLVAPEHPAALVDAMAAETTHIVTLSVTEKGYKVDPASGILLADDPDVTADIADPARPRTAPGFLVAALARRRERGLPAFTAISCDNLPHNGRRLRDAVLALAERSDPKLRDWIAQTAAFPETMVDRIVPATDERDIEALAARTGVIDRAMVKTEPFLQWVIEDRFAGPRPDFESVGVQVAADVAPWEEAKLRLLNGAHSAIAYLGGLGGIAFVHEFVALDEGRRFVEQLWDESAATLVPPPGLDLAEYRSALMARFANSSLQHRTVQIAMDGSQKLPQRLLAPIATRLERGQSIHALSLGVAAWMQWQTGRTDDGQSFSVDDPLASETARRIATAREPRERVKALLAIRAIFPPALAANEAFEDALVRQLERLAAVGARATVRQFIAEAAIG